jgi:hypothetical protein
MNELQQKAIELIAQLTDEQIAFILTALQEESQPA